MRDSTELRKIGSSAQVCSTLKLVFTVPSVIVALYDKCHRLGLKSKLERHRRCTAYGLSCFGTLGNNCLGLLGVITHSVRYSRTQPQQDSLATSSRLSVQFSSTFSLPACNKDLEIILLEGGASSILDAPAMAT